MTMRGWVVLGTVTVGLVARAAGAATPMPGKIAKTTIVLAKQ